MLVVPAHVVDKIRAHALSVRDGMEVGGRLVVEDDVVLRYDRARNASREPYRFAPGTSWRREEGRRTIHLHSHPVGDAWPSAADTAWARRWPGWASFAIWSVRDDRLRVWRLLGDRGYESVELVVAEPGVAA